MRLSPQLNQQDSLAPQTQRPVVILRLLASDLASGLVTSGPPLLVLEDLEDLVAMSEKAAMKVPQLGLVE